MRAPEPLPRREGIRMQPLTSSQRRYLKSLAHHLDPVCYVGKHGLTDAVVEAIERAFTAHELLKVKFIDGKKEKREIAARIEEETGSRLVGVVGNVAVFYRTNPDEEKRRIVLPER